ncbi:BrnT family toxin [Bdellovibrio bacteriovorus]|uniref:BrnT family toxin n=1 Tax=Bdellovibrio bacteriovorus TaxID=959 RepID=UPI0035A68B7D
MYFEWDNDKADSNFKKHGVRFSEASSVFHDLNALEIFDPDNSSSEERWIRLGRSSKSRLIVVVYCERASPERVRIISARLATKKEARYYSIRGVL